MRRRIESASVRIEPSDSSIDFPPFFKEGGGGLEAAGRATDPGAGRIGARAQPRVGPRLPPHPPHTFIFPSFFARFYASINQ